MMIQHDFWPLSASLFLHFPILDAPFSSVQQAMAMA